MEVTKNIETYIHANVHVHIPYMSKTIYTLYQYSRVCMYLYFYFYGFFVTF